jgi:hypothetical protein
MSKVTKWRGAKRDVVARIEWCVVDVPRVRFVNAGAAGRADGYGEGREERNGGEEFLRRGRFNKIS